MISLNGVSRNSANGIHTNGHATDYLPCASDYEAAPIADTTQKPAWQSAFPKFTHNISFVDGDGCQHSLTLRSDNLKDLFSDLRMVKAMVRASKANHVAKSSDAGDTQQVNDTQRCQIHSVDMPRRWSKRTGGHYFGHKMADGSFCYGRAKTF